MDEFNSLLDNNQEKIYRLKGKSEENIQQIGQTQKDGKYKIERKRPKIQ